MSTLPISVPSSSRDKHEMPIPAVFVQFLCNGGRTSCGMLDIKQKAAAPASLALWLFMTWKKQRRTKAPRR